MKLDARTPQEALADWEAFRATKLLWFTNRLLHVFGWAIIYSYDDNNKLLSVWPQRVGFRGFTTESENEGFKGLSKYLASIGPELVMEVEDD